MDNKIYNFILELNFNLLNELSSIDRFGGSWSVIEKREGYRTLKELKSIATVASVGASTRIEGSKLTDDEVKPLIFNNVNVGKFEERDHQEVIGYFNSLDIISESYQDISITEGSLKTLHNILMKFSDKDQWHRGNYKQLPNSVEATNLDGSKVTIFNTTPPGYETEDAMRALVEWYHADNRTPALIKVAAFVYDFLSIHPFQDGNGRLSRLLGTLLLLKQGYSWIEYVSFEHEIENRKAEYYRVLMECQQQRPGENITPWIIFFLSCLGNIQNKLMQKLDVQKSENQMSPREKMIYSFVESHPGVQSREVAEKLNIPLPTVKKILSDMVEGKFLDKYGSGKGVNYATKKLTQMKNDIATTLTQEDNQKEFILKNKHSFIEIKKIILNPKFQWTKPDEWRKELLTHNFILKVKCYSNKGGTREQIYSVISFNNPSYYQPVFTLNYPINIPASIWGGAPHDNEFPIKIVLEITSKVTDFKFDVMLVYDAAME